MPKVLSHSLIARLLLPALLIAGILSTAPVARAQRANMDPDNNLAARLKTDLNLGYFNDGLASAGLKEELNLSASKQQYTVFAPDDAAFDTNERKFLRNPRDEEGRQELRTMFRNQIVKGRLDAATLRKRKSVETLAGNTLPVEERTIDGEQTLFVGGVEIKDADDTMAFNGIVHTVADMF